MNEPADQPKDFSPAVTHIAKSAIRGSSSRPTVPTSRSATEAAVSSAPRIRGRACSNSAQNARSGLRRSGAILGR